MLFEDQIKLAKIITIYQCKYFKYSLQIRLSGELSDPTISNKSDA